MTTIILGPVLLLLTDTMTERNIFNQGLTYIFRGLFHYHHGEERSSIHNTGDLHPDTQDKRVGGEREKEQECAHGL